MRVSGEHDVSSIARALGVSRASAYRALSDPCRCWRYGVRGGSPNASWSASTTVTALLVLPMTMSRPPAAAPFAAGPPGVVACPLRHDPMLCLWMRLAQGAQR